MPKIELLPKINSRFEDSVTKLASDGVAISKAYADVTKRIIDFAKRFHDLWEKSLELDKGSENGAHRNFLRNALSRAIGTDNKSIRSRWIAIGQYAPELSAIRTSLPPLRDSLYEVALAIEAQKPVSKWVDQGILTPQSSVRDIRGLRKTSVKARKFSPRKRHLNARITLCFETYEEAANALSTLLLTEPHFELEAHKAFGDAMKAKVPEDAYAQIAKRIR